ncbi:hypothetical protein BBJ28_00000444 [Nothophytophthora sp. Chile5]|nr:hypothetical protein BBJ28_00000444 [Nothophytophthora sp. Chile5]
MVKDRFTVNPFEGLALTSVDTKNLLDIAQTIVNANMERYENFWSVEKEKVDREHWKLIKAKEQARIYLERQDKQGQSHAALPPSQTKDLASDLPSLLCVGTTTGTLDDVMFGVVNPTLEIMRIKASYVDDLSGAAVLSTIVEPTEDDPFRSVAVKWMELDIPLQSTGLVKNRDYVYVEATGLMTTFDDEVVGYHVLHSVNFPQTHALPNRVRANMSICGFFRQVRPNVVKIYVMGLMDPAGNDTVRRLVVPNMANAFFSTLKYAHCGQMKKLAWFLEKRYAESKEIGAPNPERICVTCRKSVYRRLGDFRKSNGTCKLCFGFVCGTCKLQRKLSFVTADSQLAQRKVTFCAVCMHEALKTSASEAAKAQILSSARGSRQFPKRSVYSESSTVASESPIRTSYGFVIF